MTSQVTDTPVCPEGHGMMVPIGYECCLASEDGLVIAIVEWQSTDNGIVPWGYALSDKVKAGLPQGDRLGDQIAELMESGQLVSIYDVINAGEGYLRVDDNRAGHNWGYFIWLGDQRQDGVSFQPGAVYHWFDDKVEEHEFPRLESFDDVVALMSDPSALLITDVGDLAHKDKDDPEFKAQWSLDDRVVVWDRGTIQRNAQSRHTTDSGEENVN